MLKDIFGNSSIERIFFHIYHYGESHASGISKDFGVALTPVLQQLNKLEKAGVLVSKQIGRSRMYSFNPKSPYAKPIKEIVKITYEGLSLTDKESLFHNRRRPRRKGKPIK